MTDTPETTPLDPSPSGKADAAALHDLSHGLATDVSAHDLALMSDHAGRAPWPIDKALQVRFTAVGMELLTMQQRLAALEVRLESLAAEGRARAMEELPDAGLKVVDLSNHMDPGEHRVSIFSAPSWPRESEGAFTQIEVERDCLGMSIPAKPAELQEAAPEHDVVAPRIAGGVVADHIGGDDLVRPDDTE